MFDKLLVTTLVRMTHEPDTYHGPFLRLFGAQVYIEKQEKKNPFQELEWKCAVCVCVYHVEQKYVSDSPGVTGECIACMAFECIHFQVDVIAGDGNKACYQKNTEIWRSPHIRKQPVTILDPQDG